MAALGAILVAGCAHADLPVPASTGLVPLARAPDGDSDRQERRAPLVVDPSAIAAESREVGLEELLAYADEHAPALVVAARRRRHGEAAREGASPLLPDNPTLEAGIGPRFDEGHRGVDFDISLRQPVEIAGQRGLRLEVAERLGERLEAEIVLVRRDVRQQILLAYRDGVVARERVRIADSLVAFAEDMLGIAQRRLTAGEVSIIDVRLAEGDAASARQASVLAGQALRQARLTLCEVTGWPLETPPMPHGVLEAPRPVPTLDSMLALASARHPELVARQAAVAEAHARAKLADREAWPSPSVGISVTREASAPGSTYIVLGTIGLSLPFWQRNQAERARAQADEDVARTEQSAAATQLRARIARAHTELEAAAERLGIFTSAVTPSLEDSLALLRRGFDAGEIPLIDVAVARERFLETRRDGLGAYADYYRALAVLEALVGADLTTTRSGRKLRRSVPTPINTINTINERGTP